MRDYSKKLPFTALLQDLGLVCDVLHNLCKFSNNVQECNMDLNKVYHNISNLEQIIEEDKRSWAATKDALPKLPEVSAPCSFTS
jgi:hypothetical protein